MNELALKTLDIFNVPNLLQQRPPTLAVRFGRGRTGGSTLLDLIIQLARHSGRDVIIGDGDRRNPTLAGLYPPGETGGALQPTSDEAVDVKDWLTELLSRAAGDNMSAVLDLGGGDRVMQEYGRDLGLVEFCADAGIEPLGLFFMGPEADDFEHVLSIWKAGYFCPPRSILIFNEHLVPASRSPEGAFDAIRARPEMQELRARGAQALLLPRLPCMSHLRESGLSFVDAVANRPGRSGRPFDPVRRFMVRQWIGKILSSLDRAGALGWLP